VTTFWLLPELGGLVAGLGRTGLLPWPLWALLLVLVAIAFPATSGLLAPAVGHF